MVSWRNLYLAFLTLLALERLCELALSRKNAGRSFARGGIEVGQHQYRLMAAFHVLFLVACAAQVAVWPHARPTPLGWIALAGALVAQALRYWAIVTLGDRWNVRVIVVPHDAAVVAGPYRFIRHPNYVAVALEMLCVPLVYAGSWLLPLAFSLGNALLLRQRIRTEEAALGSSYAQVFAHTPRFLPGGPRERF